MQVSLLPGQTMKVAADMSVRIGGAVPTFGGLSSRSQ